MANLAVQGVYELAKHGRLTPETDYAIRDELDLVSDEERKAHDEAEDKAESESPASKPAATVKKGN